MNRHHEERRTLGSTDRFGYQWKKYAKIIPEFEEQFLQWVFPLKKEDFKNKVVLDAGCGIGRNSFWALQWGSKELVAFDYDERSVKAAQRNLGGFSNAKVLFLSIYDQQRADMFDLVFSIGVIHHLEHPKLAIGNLIRSLKKGGTLLIWVYSYEGNEWIIRLVNPIRENITSKLPVWITHFISYFCSVPLWIFVKIFKGPNPYFRQLASFNFRHIHLIVFDQLIPKISNYWSRQQIDDLISDYGINEIRITRPPNNCGWNILIKKR